MPTINDSAYIVDSGTAGIAGTSATCSTLSLGSSAGSGTVQLSAGTLAATYQDVGNSGSGRFVQSGGYNDLGYLQIGYQAGSYGTYSLSGTGQIVGSTNGYGSQEYVGSSGTGVFSQSGGTNAIIDGNGSQLYLGYGAASNGSYTLTAGQLTVSANVNSQGDEYIGYHGSGLFTQTGGTHLISAYQSFDVSGDYAGSSGTYALGGGVVAGRQLLRRLGGHR